MFAFYVSFKKSIVILVVDIMHSQVTDTFYMYSFDTNPYTDGTANFGGEQVDHTFLDVLPRLVWGSSSSPNNWSDRSDRF